MLCFELSLWALIGLIIGSFLNVCIDRLSLQFSKKETRLNLLRSSETPSTIKRYILYRSISIIKPLRSFCYNCGKKIKWFENIPIFSYFFCKGICRECKTVIGSRIIYTETMHFLFYISTGYILNDWFYTLILCIIFSFSWFIANFWYLQMINKKSIFM